MTENIQEAISRRTFLFGTANVAKAAAAVAVAGALHPVQETTGETTPPCEISIPQIAPEMLFSPTENERTKISLLKTYVIKKNINGQEEKTDYAKKFPVKIEYICGKGRNEGKRAIEISLPDNIIEEFPSVNFIAIQGTPTVKDNTEIQLPPIFYTFMQTEMVAQFLQNQTTESTKAKQLKFYLIDEGWEGKTFAAPGLILLQPHALTRFLDVLKEDTPELSISLGYTEDHVNTNDRKLYTQTKYFNIQAKLTPLPMELRQAQPNPQLPPIKEPLPGTFQT